MNTLPSIILVPLMLLFTLALLVHGIIRFSEIQQSYKVAETAQSLASVWFDPELMTTGKPEKNGDGTIVHVTESHSVPSHQKMNGIYAFGYGTMRAEQINTHLNSLAAGDAFHIGLKDATLQFDKKFSLIPFTPSRLELSGTQPFDQLRERLGNPFFASDAALDAVNRGLGEYDPHRTRATSLTVAAPVFHYTDAMRAWDLAYCTVGSMAVHIVGNAISSGNVKTVDALICLKR